MLIPRAGGGGSFGEDSSPDDLDPKCSHEFGIVNEKGEETRYPTERLVAYIKQLENQGALPNLILGSCYSGRAKRFLKGLKKTCSFTLSTGAAVGWKFATC